MFGRLALHTWSLDTTPLADAIKAAKAGGFDGIELRRVDFLRCREQGMANEEVLDLLRGHGMPVHMLGGEHGWLFAKGAESQRLFDVLEESCENAVALDCPVVMAGPGPNDGAVSEGIDNLKRAGDICGKYGLRLAFEFNSRHASINAVAPARELVDGAGQPNVGLLIDAYHLERCGLGAAGLDDLAPEEIFAFQYSDVPAAPPAGTGDRATDRLPPGQGQVNWVDLFRRLHSKGFGGYLSYEAPNPQAWARAPAEVCREAADATRALIAQAVGAAR